MLLDYGAEMPNELCFISTPDHFATQPAQVAIVGRHFTCLKELLCHGINPNYCVKPLFLFYLALKNNAPLEVLHLLYETGASPYSKTPEGKLLWEYIIDDQKHRLCQLIKSYSGK